MLKPQANLSASLTKDATEQKLSWDGDNSKFVVEVLLEQMEVPADVRQVLRWAYGYDGEEASYEPRSDGSSVVRDNFLGGIIKEPYGVGHDYLYSLHREKRTAPDGSTWGYWKCQWWYRKALRAFGYPWRAVERWIGLCLFGWPAWNSKKSR